MRYILRSLLYELVTMIEQDTHIMTGVFDSFTSNTLFQLLRPRLFISYKLFVRRKLTTQTCAKFVSTSCQASTL
jgi:poly(3-hydroxyalkanoate) synthetase